MFKRLIPLFAVLFVLTAVSTSFADSEDEIIAQYLSKKEKTVVTNHIGYISGKFAYGKLSDFNGYNSQVSYLATSDLSGVDGIIAPTEGIFRTTEISLYLGMMVRPQISMQLGFDYWLKMGGEASVNQTTTIGVLEEIDNYVGDSKLSVIGGTVGVDYYFLNHPDNQGILHSMALKLGVGGGFYSASWNVWQESNASAEPIKSSAPGFYIQGGVEYPTPLFDLVVGLNASYFYLNFGDFNSYNENGGDLQLSYEATGETIEIDFSGPRAQFELKRYLKW